MMKMKINKLTIWLLGITALFSGCLEEKFPTNVAVSEQIEGSEDALRSLANGVFSFLNVENVNDGYGVIGWGYGARLLAHATMGPDDPLPSASLDYVAYPYGRLIYLGDNAYQSTDWYYYYQQIFACNQVLGKVDLTDLSKLSDEIRVIVGQTLVIRAWMYYDLAVTYEFKRTGLPELDASLDDVRGLTTPIVTEKTTEAENFSNPRAPYYKMYRFILNDLNMAEECLAGFTRANKGRPDQSVVFGVKARVWLELGSRFRIYPEDLAETLVYENDETLAAYDKLGITTKEDCYANAAEYARKAIDFGGYSPLTKDQWHNATTGFNDATSQNSWMMAILITEDATPYYYYYAWAAEASVETTWGVQGINYSAHNRINNALYDQIATTDWRKTTWIDPADAGNAPGSKYVTLLSDAQFKALGAYTGLKFRPGDGNMYSDVTGNAVDIPMMRVEEMYLIEAEAAAYAKGLSTGKGLLQSFVSTYRDPAYTSKAADLDEFVREVLTQKRIEFWLEGIGALDFKRLEIKVERGYPGTIWLTEQRFNSVGDGYVAPWMNTYIVSSEYRLNTAIVPNPDATAAIANNLLWTEE
jgi:hypothetical protein